MNTSDIQTRDLVLIGGGHTHALVLRMWGMARLPGARVTVINPGPTAPYSGMLPGFVAGHYTRDALDIDLVQLARFAGARIILGAVTGVDREQRTVFVPGRPPIGYDVLSVDVGLTADMPALPGFGDHAVPAKPLGAFATAWDAQRDKDGPIVVLGGGVAGVELALAMAHARQGRGGVTVVDRGRVLSVLPKRPRAQILRALHRFDVQIIEHAD
ncbi:MAG: FAD-dependent oxidoreductase, partial [Paracoccaceae bacterium]